MSRNRRIRSFVAVLAASTIGLGLVALAAVPAQALPTFSVESECTAKQVGPTQPGQFYWECEGDLSEKYIVLASNSQPFPMLFNGLDLHGSTIVGTAWTGYYATSFQGANLQGADLSGVDAHGADFRSSNLRDANLGSSYFVGATFVDADLRGATLRNANLGGTNFDRVQLTGSDIIPDSVVARATAGSGTAVNYTIPSNSSMPESCAPASGSVFALGATTVTCTTTGTYTVFGTTITTHSTGTFTVTVYRDAEVTDDTLPVFVNGQHGSAAFQVVGDGTIAFSTSSPLPPGLTLASTGTVSGTPTGGEGPWPVTVHLAQTLPNGDPGVETDFSTTIQVQPAVVVHVGGGGQLSGATIRLKTPTRLTLNDLPEGTTVHGVVHSDPIDLGTVTVGADHTATFPLTLPAGFATGEHELSLDIVWGGGNGPAYSASTTFTVAAAAAAGDPELAATGGAPSPWAFAVAGLVLLLGVTLRFSTAGRRAPVL